MKNTDNSALFSFDSDYRLTNGTVCGCDEAGRGPLCGPVFAAAVVLDEGTLIPDLNDSKKLSPLKRDQIYEQILQNAKEWAVAFSDVDIIEKVNILNASLLAMKKAVESLKSVPGIILIDGNCTRGFDGYHAVSVVKGDSKSASVAAASILAKVSRDRYMDKLDEIYPEYGFAKHKGYPTKEHYEAIKKYGITEYHRRSFLKNLDSK